MSEHTTETVERGGFNRREALKKAAVAAQRILQEKKEVRPIRRLTSPVGRTPS